MEEFSWLAIKVHAKMEVSWELSINLVTAKAHIDGPQQI